MSEKFTWREISANRRGLPENFTVFGGRFFLRRRLAASDGTEGISRPLGMEYRAIARRNQKKYTKFQKYRYTSDRRRVSEFI
jgi:hypothetical protein